MYAYKSIVLSGNTGAGKSTLAQALSKEYGWRIHSVGGLWRDKYKKEHPNGDITFAEFWSRVNADDNRKVDEQAKTMLENGEAIGEFRYVKNLDLKICLLVFITADLNTRVKRAAAYEEYKGMSLQEITEVIERREKDLLDMAHKIYGQDYDYRDPKNYLVILNSGKLTVAQEVDVINTLMKK